MIQAGSVLAGMAELAPRPMDFLRGAPVNASEHLRMYERLGLTPIPLKPRSKEPLVRWKEGDWEPNESQLLTLAERDNINWGVRCGRELTVLDIDSVERFENALKTLPIPPNCPVVKTGRGGHIWFKPKRPMPSQRVDGLEIKGTGAYVVAPPSVHPNGEPYTFVVAPEGPIPEIDIEELLGADVVTSLVQAKGQHKRDAPSDFAMRYGKSPWPQSMCGMATKVLTRSDRKVKRLLSLRCWKWNCPKCAPLLKRHWMEKTSGLSFRFILRLNSVNKPTAFLRRTGKPRYVHIVANGESWLFLMDGEPETVWAEARRVAYELVAGDIAGDPTADDICECLDKALCFEEDPLNTRRKITHSRGLMTKAPQCGEDDESKRHADSDGGEEDDMRAASGKEPLTWESEIVVMPIEDVAQNLAREGWQILWKSEVEALAIKDEALEPPSADIVELLTSLGIQLKREGKEYKGLCPFHDEDQASLSVNREKGLWHCFGCGKGGNIHQFILEWEEKHKGEWG